MRRTNSRLSKSIDGMSRIDSMVILGFAGISLAIYYNPDAIWKILGISFLVIVLLILVSVTMDARRQNLRLKALFEKGEIDRESYIIEVGQKYYRKHHGASPEKDEPEKDKPENDKKDRG